MALDVLYEDNHLIAVNKKAGELVQGDDTGDQPLPDRVKSYLKEKFNKQGNVFLGVVHRLDRPTSGIVVFARTSKALSRMNDLFRHRETQKTYWALCEDRPAIPEGKLVDYLAKNPKQNKSYVVGPKHPKAKKAELSFRLLASLDRYHLIEVDLHTGRHHQIRAQLAAMGCIIKGDLKYGAKRSNPGGNISLHARRLSFTHPVQKENLTLTAPCPADKVWQAAENTMR